MSDLIKTFGASEGNWASATQETPGVYVRSLRVGRAWGSANPNEGIARCVVGVDPRLLPNSVADLSGIIIRVNVTGVVNAPELCFGYFEGTTDPRNLTPTALYNIIATGDTWGSASVAEGANEIILNGDEVGDLKGRTGDPFWGMSVFIANEAEYRRADFDSVALVLVGVQAVIPVHGTIHRRRRSNSLR